MTEFQNLAEIKYETPSRTVFENRKIFYGIQKGHSEELQEWFERIQAAIDGCDFGNLSNFLTIDKFISGLSENIFEKFCQTTQLSVEELLTIALSDEQFYKSSFIDTKFETINDIDEFISLDLVKTNDSGDDEEFLRSEDSNQSEYNSNLDQTSTVFTTSLSPIETKDEIQDDNDVPYEPDISMEKNQKLKGFQIDNEKRIICLDCDKVFRLKSSYNLHKRTHTGKNLHQCKSCEKCFTTRSKLKRHMLTHIHDGRSFVCYLCRLDFEQCHALKSHFNVKHSISKKDGKHCTLCEKVFLSQKSLEHHLKCHQGLEQMHKCPHCDKEYDRLYKLTVHLVVHSDYKPFICETCGKGFKIRRQLKLHSQRHGVEKPYKCTECTQSFKSSFSHKNHMRSHTGERPFPCNLCEKTFAQRSNLLKHLMVHRQEKPYPCTMCDKRFASLYHRKIHMSVHTGAKPYKCTQCNKAFTQPGTLKIHIQRLHSTNIPSTKDQTFN